VVSGQASSSHGSVCDSAQVGRFRRVGPGLYERIDTPRHVEIGGRLLDAVRAENPWLADLLVAAERAAAERLRQRTWWRWWA
jgi:hypothetical protein